MELGDNIHRDKVADALGVAFTAGAAFESDQRTQTPQGAAEDVDKTVARLMDAIFGSRPAAVWTCNRCGSEMTECVTVWDTGSQRVLNCPHCQHMHVETYTQ